MLSHIHTLAYVCTHTHDDAAAMNTWGCDTYIHSKEERSSTSWWGLGWIEHRSWVVRAGHPGPKVALVQARWMQRGAGFGQPVEEKRAAMNRISEGMSIKM